MCPGEINTAGKSRVTEPLPCPCAGHSRLWGAPLPALPEIQCDLIPLFRPFHAVPPSALSCVLPLTWAKRGVLLARGWWGAPWRNLPAPAAPAEWAELGFLPLSPADARCCPLVRNHLALNPGLHTVPAHSLCWPLGTSASGQLGHVGSGPGGISLSSSLHQRLLTSGFLYVKRTLGQLLGALDCHHPGVCGDGLPCEHFSASPESVLRERLLAPRSWGALDCRVPTRVMVVVAAQGREEGKSQSGPVRKARGESVVVAGHL